MLSTLAKFSLSDASDFLNSDDDSENTDAPAKSRSVGQVLHNFVQLSGQNSSSESEECLHRNEERDKNTSLASKKNSVMAHLPSRAEPSKRERAVGNNSNGSPASNLPNIQIKKRAGDCLTCGGP